MPMQLSVEFAFCAAHRLPYYNGPCSRLHGHNYKLQIVVEGTVNPKDGMLQDFEEIRRKVWESTLSNCDHHNLNDVPGLENSTCENIAIYVWRALRPQIATLSAVTVWETYDSKCTYRGG